MTRTSSRVPQLPASSFCHVPTLLGVGPLLLCACPVWAQTLSVSAGTATVSGAGTTGTGITFGGGAGPGTSS